MGQRRHSKLGSSAPFSSRSTSTWPDPAGHSHVLRTNPGTIWLVEIVEALLHKRQLLPSRVAAWPAGHSLHEPVVVSPFESALLPEHWQEVPSESGAVFVGQS